MKLFTWIVLFNITYLNCGLNADQNFESYRGSQVSWARLKCEVEKKGWNDWRAHPVGDLNLIKQMRKRTSINIELKWNVADIRQLDEMCQFPLLFMHAQNKGYLRPLHRENIREYLLRGGFLFIDDCVLSHEHPNVFYKSMVKIMPEILPEAKLELLEKGHEIFDCFYEFKKGFPHIHRKVKYHKLYGLYLEGRLSAVISSTDLHCGWVKAGWFGRLVELEALKMGINIYIYAMNH